MAEPVEGRVVPWTTAVNAKTSGWTLRKARTEDSLQLECMSGTASTMLLSTTHLPSTLIRPPFGRHLVRVGDGSAGAQRIFR
jgi:hypothetical protein